MTWSRWSRSLREEMGDYVQEYKSYFEANKSDGDKMFHPAPRVVLIPQVGMITMGKDADWRRCLPTYIIARSM